MVLPCMCKSDQVLRRSTTDKNVPKAPTPALNLCYNVPCLGFSATNLSAELERHNLVVLCSPEHLLSIFTGHCAGSCRRSDMGSSVVASTTPLSSSSSSEANESISEIVKHTPV